jgi:hypothetical protein
VKWQRKCARQPFGVRQVVCNSVDATGGSLVSAPKPGHDTALHRLLGFTCQGWGGIIIRVRRLPSYTLHNKLSSGLPARVYTYTHCAENMSLHTDLLPDRHVVVLSSAFRSQVIRNCSSLTAVRAQTLYWCRTGLGLWRNIHQILQNQGSSCDFIQCYIQKTVQWIWTKVKMLTLIFVIILNFWLNAFPKTEYIMTWHTHRSRLVSWDGVRLSPLGTSAANWPVVPAPVDYDECGAVGTIRIGRETEVLEENLDLAPLCPPQIPHDLTWARTRAAAVGSRLLAAWAMARPLTLIELRAWTEGSGHFSSF